MCKLDKVGFLLVFATMRLIATPQTAQASNITLQGLFTQDDNVQLFNLTIAAAGTVDIRSYGYADGAASTGTVAPSGGFDTILTLYAGRWINRRNHRSARRLHSSRGNLHGGRALSSANLRQT